MTCCTVCFVQTFPRAERYPASFHASAIRRHEAPPAAMTSIAVLRMISASRSTTVWVVRRPASSRTHCQPNGRVPPTSRR
jgi:hypothetical protein